MKLSREANTCARAIVQHLESVLERDIPFDSCLKIVSCIQTAINNEAHVGPPPIPAPGDVTFIGGIADGQRLPDPGLPHYRIADDAPVPVFVEGPTPSGERKVDGYRRERLRSGHREWIFYVLESMTTEQAFERLVLGYRYPREST